VRNSARFSRADSRPISNDNAKLSSQRITNQSTMGMYDDITCEHVLPLEPKPKSSRLQTKDFDRLMDHYTITNDGRLLKRDAFLSAIRPIGGT
jgi:hypothetical protein